MVFGSDSSMAIAQISSHQRCGFCCWSDSEGDTKVRFVGRGPKMSNRQEVLRAVHHLGSRLVVSQLQQVHSNSVVQAVPGDAGRGDALITGESSLALSIASADCVPVLFANGERTAAVHAGWRGIAAGIVPAVARLLAKRQQRTTAWIGPSIGPCCYEVGGEVSSRLHPWVKPGKTHCRYEAETIKLDLGNIVAEQLKVAGIQDIRRISTCTQCNPDLLWSYRGENRSPGGRNLAFIWRES